MKYAQAISHHLQYTHDTGFPCVRCVVQPRPRTHKGPLTLCALQDDECWFIVSMTVSEVMVLQCTQVTGGILPCSGAVDSSTLGSYIPAATLDIPSFWQLCVFVCLRVAACASFAQARACQAAACSFTHPPAPGRRSHLEEEPCCGNFALYGSE